MNDKPLLLTSKQVSARFGISARTLKDLRSKRAITFYRVNSKTILHCGRSIIEYLQRVRSDSRFEQPVPRG
jgi:hypothetical protein